MKYKRRLLEEKLAAFVESFACTLVTGARQVGIDAVAPECVMDRGNFDLARGMAS